MLFIVDLLLCLFLVDGIFFIVSATKIHEMFLLHSLNITSVFLVNASKLNANKLNTGMHIDANIK